MYVLGIDTSTMTGGAALLKGEELVGESILNIRTTHSERLIPALDELLGHARVQLQDVGLISVVTGPGSFTGLRIGLATAKGFGYALGIPLAGVTTLEAFGWQFQVFPGIVVALIDARRRSAFWQAFQGGEGLTEPGHGSLEDVLGLSLIHICVFPLPAPEYIFCRIAEINDKRINFTGSLDG